MKARGVKLSIGKITRPYGCCFPVEAINTIVDLEQLRHDSEEDR